MPSLSVELEGRLTGIDTALERIASSVRLSQYCLRVGLAQPSKNGLVVDDLRLQLHKLILAADEARGLAANMLTLMKDLPCQTPPPTLPPK